MKKLNKFLVSYLLAVMMCSMVACTGNPVTSTEGNPATSTGNEISATKYEYTVTPVDGAKDVDWHTDVQLEFLNSGATTTAGIKYEGKDIGGNRELSKPNPVTLTWTDGPKLEKYFIQLSTDSQFREERGVFEYETTVSSLNLYNLYLNQKYYWRVAADPNTAKDATVYTFKTTAQAPRVINLEGVTVDRGKGNVFTGVSNVRDLGGWQTEGGETVRQGMVYRGAALNNRWTDSNNEFKSDLTDEGLKTLTEVLKIKTEIDLRENDSEEGQRASGSFPGVTHVNCAPFRNTGNSATQNILIDNVVGIKKAMEVFTKEENYPVYFHCKVGTDRTGIIAFLLNGLLGVSKENLYRDYVFSNFGVVNSNLANNPRQPDTISAYVKIIDGYPGDTFAQKIENVLIDFIGLTKAQVDSIRNIMLEN